MEACGSKENLPVPFFRTSNELTDRLAAEGKGPAHSSPEYFKAITERLKKQAYGGRDCAWDPNTSARESWRNLFLLSRITLAYAHILKSVISSNIYFMYMSLSVQSTPSLFMM